MTTAVREEIRVDIERSLKKYIVQSYTVLSLFFILNIIHFFVGIRYLVIMGDYIPIPVPYLTVIFIALYPVYFASGWGVSRQRGGDQLVREYILYDPRNVGTPLRDRSLAYPLLMELGAFTGLVDLLHTQQWYFFGFAETMAVGAILLSFPTIRRWRRVVEKIYSEIPQNLFDEKASSQVGGDA